MSLIELGSVAKPDAAVERFRAQRRAAAGMCVSQQLCVCQQVCVAATMCVSAGMCVLWRLVFTNVCSKVCKHVC